jgi:hypothetical protein
MHCNFVRSLNACLDCVLSLEGKTTPGGEARIALHATTQLRIERHSRIRSTSLSVISSFVRS